MKILYVHGFGSGFNPTHNKIQALETLGTVFGVDVDYCKGYRVVFNEILDAVTENHIDLIVGTSMGGYMAAQVGSHAGIPFVSMNPAVTPSSTLTRWEGNFVDYNNNLRHLSGSVIQTYPDIVKTGCGLVLLDMADEVIDAWNTEELLSDAFEVHTFAGGTHRFSHVNQSLSIIAKFYENAQVVYSASES